MLRSSRSYAVPGLFAALMLGLSAFRAGAESLQGRLIDCASLQASTAGRGVAGARLTLFDAAGKKLGVKTSSKQGLYRFPKLAPGTYTLAISHKEYPASPLRLIALAPEDTVARDFALVGIPVSGGFPVRAPGKGKKLQADYYPRLAEGMVSAMARPGVHREARDRITLSRFFDAEDTTDAYHALAVSLLWAEIESQQLPVEAEYYLAHALDSALQAANLPQPAALKPYLKVSPDSLEAVARAVGMLLAAPKIKPGKPGPEALTKKQVPKALVLQVIEERFASKGIPKPRKKAFLTAIKGAVGADAARRFALLIEPPKKKAAAARKTAPAGPPQPDTDGLWKAVTDLAGGKRPNAVALFHIALRRLEQGQPREAWPDLERVGALRPDYPQAIGAMARCRLALADTAGAAHWYDSLSHAESPEWQALGFQGAAKIQWRSGQAEAAERSLWRALGLDGRSPAAREALLLLAEVSLTRDSWSSVEGLLDSLVKTRPREPDGHFWLGRMAMKRQQDGVALEHFQKAYALAPQRVEFAAAVAGAYFAREECEAALKTLKPVRARLSGEGLSIYGQCLLRQGKAKEAVQEFERLQAAHPSPGNLVQWARALSATGDAKRAVAAIQASSYSGDFGVRKALAAAEIDEGSADKARQLLEPLEAGKENDAELHFLLGRAAFSLREYSEASKRYASALQYQEDYPEAKYGQGVCLLKLGRSGEAHHYFQELADSDRPSWRAKGLLGQGQAFAKEEKPEAAAENLRKSFQASPSAEAAAHLALACLRLERVDEAADWAAKARKLDPNEPLGLMAAVDALLAGHKEAEAVAMAQAGLDRHPDACDFLVVAAKAHLRAGHDQQARDLSQRASGRCPEESAPYFYLGTLSARAGTVAEARRHFGEYLRTGGDARRVPEGYR